MSDLCYIGQIEIFGFNFVPPGWMRCDGSMLSVDEYSALFSVLGVTYGGNGIHNFALPDLRGRLAMGAQTSHPLGWAGGKEDHLLTVDELPVHSHGAYVSVEQDDSSTSLPLANESPTVMLSSSAVAPEGGGQPHDNVMPSLALSYCICVEGVYPPSF